MFMEVCVCVYTYKGQIYRYMEVFIEICYMDVYYRDICIGRYIYM